MPNADRAVVDLVKVRDYCLNPEHPRGRHKARVFASALGFTASNATDLRDLLLAAAQTRDPTLGDADEYGQRYILDFPARGPAGQAAVRSTWIVRTGEDFPRLTSCYVL
jgi:hypothetical protein